MTGARARDILIGPRTTVFVLLEAYPSLETFLLARDSRFEPLTEPRARTRWARVTSLNDVAVGMNITWRQLVREIAAEVVRTTGKPARVADSPRRVGVDDRRLGELREIADGLEHGASLLEMADRWRELTQDLEPGEVAALDAALAEAAGADAGRGLAAGTRGEGVVTVPPEGHPLETLRREAVRIAQLCAGLGAELERLGGSPTRRRWARARQLVSRLVDRLGGVESRFRREQQAWFPALGVHGVNSPQSLLAGRQAEALETLRRLHLAVARDDALTVAEAGSQLVDLLKDLLAQDERLLEPLAEQYFSTGDWAAVRELEDGVGWRLIPPPPRWPPA